ILMNIPAAAYIHIPFCRTRCDYCDFFSLAGTDQELREKTIDAICAEILGFFRRHRDYYCHTVYIGGGTPNSLEPKLLEKILSTVCECTDPALLREWTIEANPEFINSGFLDLTASYGVTRLSMGIQSFQPRILELLGRNADLAQTEQACEIIAKFWTGDVSFDLIHTVPGQDRAELEKDIARMLREKPEHLSLYALTIEKGTALARSCARADFRMPGQDEAADLYEYGLELLAHAGYRHYEISNFCRNDRICMHNLMYWQLNCYIGFGPSAAGTWVDGGKVYRVINPSGLSDYLSGKKICELLSPADLMKDQLLMNFRLDSGLDTECFIRRFGSGPEQYFPETIKKWSGSGLLVHDTGNLYLTNNGQMLLNTFLTGIFSELEDKKISLQQFP
ncbi:MAG: radical SAM family heme chaperone HemW, partial [Spirochaetales bacterium]|nr:radical SAM family heme chaperone HemW [Spirochaetales bacterium]